MKLWLTCLALFTGAATLPVHGNETAAQKVGITELYAMALERDPEWLAAQKEWQASIQQQNIARAGLLPDVRLNYQNAPRNRQQWEGPQTVNSRTQHATTVRNYSSHNGSITLTQPLFDYGAWSRYRASLEQGFVADERLREKTMDLAVRLINYYIDIALAQQRIDIALSQQKALQEHHRLNVRQYEAGEGTRTEVLETQASLRLAETELIALRDELEVARWKLAAMVDHPLDNLQQLKIRVPDERFRPQPLSPASFESWRALALKRSAAITQARHMVSATHHELQAQNGEFMPRVNLYASHSISKSATDNTISQRYETTSAGIQVSVPLFSGGRSIATLKQASARLGQNQYLLESTTHSTLNELRKYWRLCSGIESRLQAWRMAVESARLQLTATRKGVVAGQRVNLDVLNAEQQLYSTSMDLATEEYSYLRAWLMLHYHSGTMNQEVIETIGNYFH